MSPLILAKVRVYYPVLRVLVEKYETTHDEVLWHAIIDAVLASEARGWFDGVEIAYMAAMQARESPLAESLPTRTMQLLLFDPQPAAVRGEPNLASELSPGAERPPPPAAPFYVVRDAAEPNPEPSQTLVLTVMPTHSRSTKNGAARRAHLRLTIRTSPTLTYRIRGDREAQIGRRFPSGIAASQAIRAYCRRQGCTASVQIFFPKAELWRVDQVAADGTCRSEYPGSHGPEHGHAAS